MLPLRTPVNLPALLREQRHTQTQRRKQAVDASVCCLPVNRDATGDVFIPTDRQKQLETPDGRSVQKKKKNNK